MKRCEVPLDRVPHAQIATDLKNSSAKSNSSSIAFLSGSRSRSRERKLSTHTVAPLTEQNTQQRKPVKHKAAAFRTGKLGFLTLTDSDQVEDTLGHFSPQEAAKCSVVVLKRCKMLKMLVGGGC